MSRVSPTTLAPLELLAVSAEQAAALLGLSRSAFFKQADAGRIGPLPIRFGKSVRYSLAELKSWAAAGCPTRDRWQIMRKGES